MCGIAGGHLHGPVFFVKLLLDVVGHLRLPHELVHRERRNLNRILLHVVGHVDGLHDCLGEGRNERSERVSVW